ncbi:beta-ketoacyl synthase N-terminal-like domain-containing protein [Amycolatopsis sp. NPDC004079]|uniref:beta-ketoacyl synthase N-terminal-like domain-containing protein n=1 Tax=Amycolatopsis sp. NPDC004079 TaxID=3154549 RepID=UPI0033A3E7BD
MTGIVVTGWGGLSSAGLDHQAWTRCLRDGAGPSREPVAELDGAALPRPTPHVLSEFDRREALGRKGTRFFDRVTAFALTACGASLRDSGLPLDDSSRHRVGITLGTTLGSFRSTSDYSRETLEQEKPYLVNPVLFPNTVINCASGQAAIWFGLKGANTTVAGGHTTFLNVLRYAANALRTRTVDAMLAGAAEELSPLSAWLAHHLHPDGSSPAGEGAAVFTLERAEDAQARGRPADAEVLSVATAFQSRGAEASAVVANCLRQALDLAETRPDELDLVVTSGTSEDRELDAVLGPRGPERLDVNELLGECQAASGALQAAAVLALHREDPGRDGRRSLLVAHDADGGMAAAVLRGWSRAGSDSE